MKHFNKRIIVLLSMLAVLFGSCFNTASAKLASTRGKAFCEHTPEAIQQAKKYNAFKVGDVLDLSPAEGFTNTMRVEKTVGSVKPGTVLKAIFNWETYIEKLRGINQTAGKIFEESYCRSFNRTMRNGPYFAETTAMLGKPGDAADLLIYERQTNKLVCKVQQKLSASEAIAAITKPKNIVKYKDCTILTTSDQLRDIKSDLRKGTHKYVPKDPLQRKMIKDAIDSKKLTCSIKLAGSIHDVQARSMGYYQEATRRLYRPTFNKMCNEMLPDVSRAIREGKDFITINNKAYLISDCIDMYKKGKFSIPEIDAALRSAQFTKFARVGNTVVGIAGSVIDIGYGVYMIYNAENQFHKGLLDSDLYNYKKALGVVQIGVGVVGLVMVFSPEPFSKIVAPIVVVVGVLVAALDMWIDHIQAQRCAARQKLIDKIEAQDRPRAIRQLLIREMNIQCAL